MRNYIIGVLSGIAGAVLYASTPALAWYYWVLFIFSSILIAFSFDVITGSVQEHQPRAAWMGGLMFGGSGVILQDLVWGLGI
jgi:hypothetical protein